MGTHFKAGFTIIETILVLGVTGALVVGIFVGVGTQINIQRYRDSADSLKNLFQEQYSELASIQNDRPDTWSCNATGQTIQSSPEVRGQSDCVMLGRLVDIRNGDMTLYSVLGHEVASPDPGADDVTSLRDNYRLNVSSVVVEQGELEWSSVIARPVAGPGISGAPTPRDLSILFIRSPDSGQIYTFSSNTVQATPGPATLRNMVVSGNTIPGQGEQIICVNSNNPLLNDDLSVYMSPFAVAPGAFEIRSNQYWQQNGSSVRC